jgi:hypothetical protein
MTFKYSVMLCQHFANFLSKLLLYNLNNFRFDNLHVRTTKFKELFFSLSSNSIEVKKSVDFCVTPYFFKELLYVALILFVSTKLVKNKLLI